MKYVLNTEGDGEILGEFMTHEEDAVVYCKLGPVTERDEFHAVAPSDCVSVEEIDVAVDVMEALHLVADGLVFRSEVDTRFISKETPTLEVVIRGERYRLTVEHMPVAA